MNNDLKYRDRRIFEALNGIDEKYIAEITEKYDVFDPRAAYAPTKRAKRRMNMRILALAACIGLMVTVFCYFPQIMQTLGVPDPWGLWSQTESTDTTETPETFPPSPETEETTAPAEETVPEETVPEDTAPETEYTPPKFDLSSYDGVIKHYREIVDYCSEPGMTAEKAKRYTSLYFYDSLSDPRTYNTVSALIDSVFYYVSNGKSKFDFGYSVCNINGDGNDDLLLMLEDGSLIAVFSVSMAGGGTWLVESYGEYMQANLDGDGNVHTYNESEITVSSLSRNGRGLSVISKILHLAASVGTDYYSENDQSITKAEYDRLRSSEPFNQTGGKYTYLFRGLQFIPLAERTDGGLIGGTFTLPDGATEINFATFEGVDVNDIVKLIIGADVKRIDLELLNSFENLKYVTVDERNGDYSSVEMSMNANALLSKKTDEMLFFTDDLDWVDLYDADKISDNFKIGAEVKMYVCGGVLKLLHTGENDWNVISAEYGSLSLKPKAKMNIVGNVSFKVYRLNDGFATCYTYYGNSQAFIFTDGQAVDYNPLIEKVGSFHIKNEGDGMIFFRTESGELGYTRTAKNLKTVQTNEWYVGYLKSPNVVWQTEGIASISDNKIVFTPKNEYTVEDYLKEKGTTLRAWFRYMKEEEGIKYNSLNDLFVAQGGKKYYPDKITKYSDAEMIKIFEEVFAGKREIVSSEYTYLGYGNYLAECRGYNGKEMAESLFNNVFYYDYNDDGILDALYSPYYGGDTDFILHYQDGKVYAIGFSPRDGYAFYANGEFGFGAVRYRITEFNGLDYKTETIDYSKWRYSEPCMESPKYVSVELLRPGETSKPVSDKEPADFSSFESIIKMFKKAIDMVRGGEVTDDNITEYEMPYRFDTAGEYSTFHLMVLCAHDYSVRGKAFGYSIGDINGDGTDELIFMLEDSTVMMMFTMYEGSPRYVGIFKEYDAVYIDTDGKIHEFAGQFTNAVRVYELSKDGSGLKYLESLGITEDSGGNTYSHTVLQYAWEERVETYISKEEYDRILASAPFKKESELDTSKNPGVRFTELK